MAHIVKSFDDELSQIENLILEMGGVVETQVNECIQALTGRDEQLATKVREDDKTVDALEVQIDDLTLKILALRQPMAKDLRCVIGALKVAGNLERIGDYSKNIAKRSVVLHETNRIVSPEKTIKRMGDMVRAMISDVLNAYAAKDVVMANELLLRDVEVDYMHNTLFRELLTYMMESSQNITSCMHMLFIAKNLERMGDHVTAIAEQIQYIKTGSVPADDRPKSDVTSQITGRE